MEKTKKKINFNYLKILLCTVLGIIAGIICGLKVNMLKVHATAFSNSTITYNENQTLYTSFTMYYQTNNAYMSIWTSTNDFYVNISILTNNAIYTNHNYTNCRLSNNVITCTAYYTITPTSSGNISRNNGTYTFTINSDTVSFSDNTYSILTTGYTEQQYQAYGQQQYNAGYTAGIAYVQAHPAEYNLYTAAQYSANYTAGQNSVLNSPNTYGLYTQAQYEANYTSGYSAGVLYVQNHPAEYNLYTSAQYTAYGSSQYTAGQNAVLNDPNSYNLYTSAQYNSYGNSQFSAGESAVQNNPNSYGLYTAAQYNDNYTAGQNSVLNNPNTYGLYTEQQYTTHAQEQYNLGYAAGLIDDTEAYNAGIQYVIDNPNNYNLYTQTQYDEYGNTRYNAGIQYVVTNPSEYNLYTTQQYNTYYQEGYQAGILQGENNVTSSPNDYNLYTQTQYDNNSSYSNFIENNIESVWINTPVYDSNLGYYQQHWQKINNTYITINNSTINLTNIYTSGYTGITDIQIVLKNKFNGYTPLIIGNDSTNISNYQYAHVDLSCYNNTTANNRSNWQVCQVFGSDVQSAGNSLELDYTYLMNGENYFSVLENLGDIYINDYYNLKYNVITIGNYTYTGNTINVLDGHINSITFDLSTFNLDSYNLGYSSGYTSGQLQMQQAKYNEGYTDGYDRATELYENVGGNANTLVGLAGTILFSPVTMLKQIFNFEILGVNLSGFLLSIISLLIVAWLIKRLI